MRQRVPGWVVPEEPRELPGDESMKNCGCGAEEFLLHPRDTACFIGTRGKGSQTVLKVEEEEEEARCSVTAWLG